MASLGSNERLTAAVVSTPYPSRRAIASTSSTTAIPTVSVVTNDPSTGAGGGDTALTPFDATHDRASDHGCIRNRDRLHDSEPTQAGPLAGALGSCPGSVHPA
jgi:hypothetical protein